MKPGDICKWHEIACRYASSYWNVDPDFRSGDGTENINKGTYHQRNPLSRYLMLEKRPGSNIFSTSKNLYVFWDMLENRKIHLFDLDAEKMVVEYAGQEDPQAKNS